MDAYQKTVDEYLAANPMSSFKPGKKNTLFTLPDECYLKRETEETLLPEIVLIEDVKYDDGIQVKYLGDKFYHKGYHDLKVHNVALTPIKRWLITQMRWLIKSGLFILCIFPKYRWELATEFASYSHSTFRAQSLYLDPKYFCRSGRELYRVGMDYIKRWEGQKHETAWEILMFICMVWEYDTIYRYIGQFLFSQSLKPRKCVNEAYRRTTNPAIKKNLKYMRFISWFIPKEPLCNLDKNELYLDEADREFAGQKGGFIWQ